MTAATEDMGKVSHRSGACVGLKVSDVILWLGPEFSCTIKHYPVA